MIKLVIRGHWTDSTLVSISALFKNVFFVSHLRDHYVCYLFAQGNGPFLSKHSVFPNSRVYVFPFGGTSKPHPMENFWTSSVSVSSAEYDVKDAVLNLVMNRLTEPCSKNQATEWQQEHHDVEEYSLHQYYRAMDHLDEHRDAIEQSIYKQMKFLSGSRIKKTNIALFWYDFAGLLWGRGGYRGVFTWLWVRQS